MNLIKGKGIIVGDKHKLSGLLEFIFLERSERDHNATISTFWDMLFLDMVIWHDVMMVVHGFLHRESSETTLTDSTHVIFTSFPYLQETWNFRIPITKYKLCWLWTTSFQIFNLIFQRRGEVDRPHSHGDYGRYDKLGNTWVQHHKKIKTKTNKTLSLSLSIYIYI